MSPLTRRALAAYLRKLTPDSILKIYTISKCLHDLSLPLLLLTVDLSTHNRGLRRPPVPYGRWWYDSVEILRKGIGENKYRIVQCQKSFLSSLLQHLERARFVKHLTWTLFLDVKLNYFSPLPKSIEPPTLGRYLRCLTMSKLWISPPISMSGRTSILVRTLEFCSQMQAPSNCRES
jgi:hypothetical protein